MKKKYSWYNKKLDSDNDGVPNYKDCFPFNPHRQHVMVTKYPKIITQKDITPREKKSILKYTDLDYMDVNPELRKTKGIISKIPKTIKSSMGEKDIKRTEVQHLQRGLKKLPMYKGIVYRSISTSAERYVNFYKNKYKRGNIVTTSQYTSTTTKMSVLKDVFIQSDTDVVIIFKIYATGKKGKIISNLSRIGRGMGEVEENEVLFLPRTKFRVLSVKEKYVGKQLKINIEMQEL